MFFRVQMSFLNAAVQPRIEEYDGKEYYVVPVKMLTEGVFTCNEGAVLYRSHELRMYSESWNNRPIMMEHPVDESGNPIQSGDIETLKQQKVGFLLNARFDDNWLRADAWVDKARVEKDYAALGERIKAGEPVEVSTGLVVNCDVAKGKYAGKTYEYTAYDYRPDHLAILLDKKGACSLAHGAGLMAMQAVERPELDIPADLETIARNKVDKMVANQLSHRILRDTIHEALKALYGDIYYWIEDVFDTYVIFEIGGRMYKVDYSEKKNVVSLDISSGVTEVVKVMQYRKVDGTVIGNSSTDPSPTEENMKKKELVDFLIANAGYEETDREILDKMDEKKLTKLHEAVSKKVEKKVVNEDPPLPEPEKKTKSTDFDFDAFMNGAPKPYQRMVKQSITLMNQQINDDAAEVVKLSAGAYTVEEATAMGEKDPLALSKLRKTLSNIKPVQKDEDDDGDDGDEDEGFNYLGAGFGSQRMLSNQEDEGTEDAMSVAPPSYVPAK